MFDNNDLTMGIKQAADSISSYYEIGYYPTHVAPDGKFRRIKISLKPGLSADVNYRQDILRIKSSASSLRQIRAATGRRADVGKSRHRHQHRDGR